MSEPVAGAESLSIGEMLDLLKGEFPDVTISKIRFLESQGLLDPERTASGYRKFYQADVDRLRWILRQQRENFLPLKVIKGRLEAEGDDALAEPPPPAAPLPAHEPTPPTEPLASEAPGGSQASAASEDPEPAADDAEDPTTATFTRDELARASGLSPADLAQLERHGLLVGGAVGGQLYYDADALKVARLVAGFARHGVEPRHLRMYKNAAEREAGFYEQVVLPLMKQRNPAARHQAVETLAELAQLGAGLRGALLHRALRDVAEVVPAETKGRRRI
ncbi:MAG: MerR family transcriptional regulator [Actinobacteria bacterium]|nr:MerR family transcriptional regulator [Actinomycetota bacterium]